MLQLRVSCPARHVSKTCSHRLRHKHLFLYKELVNTDKSDKYKTLETLHQNKSVLTVRSQGNGATNVWFVWFGDSNNVWFVCRVDQIISF